MIKGLRLAFVEGLSCFGRRFQEFFWEAEIFVEVLKCFGRGRWVQELCREAGIYTFEQNQINKSILFDINMHG